VYDANLAKIGTLRDDLPQQISHLYSLAAILEDIRELDPRTWLSLAAGAGGDPPRRNTCPL
jgi:hypothetical protein